MTRYLPHFPTDRIRILYIETELQLTSLSAAVKPNAARHPGQAAPSGIVADARRLLFALARIVARERNWRGQLRLVEAPSWAELDAKLGLATAALRRFAALYIDPSDPVDEEDDEAGEDPLPPLAPARRFDKWMRPIE